MLSGNIILLTAVVLPTFTVGLIIYRIRLHPLAKYPGPLFAKVSGWHQFIFAAQGENHVHLQHLHETYGDVVRVGPNSLSFNTHTAFHDIYGDRKANVIKAGYTETHARLNGHRNLQTITDRRVYARKRRLISHAFSEEALHSSEVFIVDRVRLWCSRIFFGGMTTNVDSLSKNDSWSAPIDMKTWSDNLTLDILGELCFGQPFGAIEAKSSDFPDLIINFSAQTHIVSWIPLEPYLRRPLKLYEAIATKLNLKSMQGRHEFERAVTSMIEQRMDPENPATKNSTEQHRKDFFYYLLQATDPETGEKLSFPDIRSESGLLFGGGVDTSATCIAATMFYLVHHPATLRTLQEELTTHFDDVEPITDSELQKCVWLRACIDESLRLSPPVPGPLIRKVCRGGTTIAGQHVPEGTVVSVPAYALHHNAAYFPDPWSFRPERWMPSSSPERANREAFAAFSAGSRVCIGRRLAYMDVSLALARLLFTYDVRLAPGEMEGEGARGPEYRLEDWFVTRREGPVVQLRHRI